ncbi:MAG: Gfo/Idh/MocA family oxidoreductase [Acetatifactor sp.]|nr:Gfo/Idh/MocA family oxidoreductase [Acetatifactor sp.]
MIKVGMIDITLDNWHSNHYPDYLRDAAKRLNMDIDLCYAWGKKDSKDAWRLTNKAWSEEKGCEFCESCVELVEKSDALMVMCADDCRPHEQLAKLALESGKPVYCDKTFAPDVESAERMFAVASKYNTPVFSCSAQRFCPGLTSFREKRETADFALSQGPGDLINYSVHQFEMLQAAMGTGSVSCQAQLMGEVKHIIYRYEDERMCTFTLAPGLPFHFAAGKAAEGIREISVGQYYEPFMDAVITFFKTKKLPVLPEDTLEIMKMQQMARKAVKQPGEWIGL